MRTRKMLGGLIWCVVLRFSRGGLKLWGVKVVF